MNARKPDGTAIADVAWPYSGPEGRGGGFDGRGVEVEAGMAFTAPRVAVGGGRVGVTDGVAVRVPVAETLGVALGSSVRVVAVGSGRSLDSSQAPRKSAKSMESATRRRGMPDPLVRRQRARIK
jgi:hypothetical protein